ncbi:MAG TPA: electron transfer flavoprotein subunit beta/FixA family protein [Oscillatoriaceae cyanobacterium]
MKIVVSLKVVPDYEQVRMAQGATSLDTSSVPRVVYTFDELALEAALRLKDADASNELVVVSLTSDAGKVKETIKKALAMGADRAVIVEDKSLDTLDTWAQAQILASAVHKVGDAQLVTFGIPGIQGEAFPTGAEVAGLLGWPFVTYASGLKLNGDTVEVERHLEKGKQTVDVKAPAVVTVGKFPSDPRLPTFKGIMGAKNKPLDTWTLADLGMSPDQITSYIKAESIAPPPARGAGTKIEAEPADAAKQAVAALQSKKFI